MSCPYEEKVALYAGGDLEPTEAAAVEKHLAVCRECAELAQALDSDRELLRSAPPQLAEVDFADLRHEIVRAARRKQLVPALLAAAAVLAVAAMGLHVPHRTPAPPPPVATIPKAPLPNGRGSDMSMHAHNRAAACCSKRAERPARDFPLPADAVRVPTKDPSVVIVWFAETTGDSNE